MNRFTILFLFLFSFPFSGLTQDSTDWLLVYYAPYDNNLSQYSDSILTQLESARKYENVQIVLQVDQSNSLGMFRYTIASNGTIIDTIPSEESTSGKELSNYLKWAADNFPSRHSAVFFLDHGGGLNEVGQDLQPDSTFLTTASIQKALKKFNKRRNANVDLLYLQVCAKASIEPLYEFRDVAQFTLASQQLLGAPNYYYSETIKSLSTQPECTGTDLAKAIAVNDREDMFESLTCIDNSQFSLIRTEFSKLVKELEKKSQINFNKAPLHFDYANDRYWDLIDFLNCLDLQTPEEIAARDTLITSIQQHLIAFHHVPQGNTTKYSGISIAALSRDRIRSFWKMRFYRDCMLQKLPID